MIEMVEMNKISEKIYAPHIVGNGDIAQALRGIHGKGRLFFASGVSNSSETDERQYQREKELLLCQTLQHTERLVYFSSLAVLYTDPPTRYTAHKKEMEDLVKSHFKRWCIVRIGNIDWGTNPHTLINFLKGQHQRGEKMNIQDTYRYIVGKDEFLHWIDLIPSFNSEINIPGRRMKVEDIVKEYVVK